ncbi:MAG: hypothetical protein KGJ59_12260, partial [Bacteroidota bacterium]|nr:hypothetical protein [Bacteroidota bacterium]
MPYFSNHPNVFRAVTIALFSVMVSIAITCFYDYVSSPTDENWFRDTPSSVYIVNTIPGQSAGEGRKVPGSVAVGDLVVALNGIQVNDSAGVAAVLRKNASASTLTVTVLRPTEDKRITLPIASKDFTEDHYIRIPFTVHVYDVFPGGASDRAGMKVGDLVERINNKGFKSALDADRMLRTSGTGKTVTYD